MAAIDKTYVNWEDYKAFREWCYNQPKVKDIFGKEVSISKYLYKYDNPFHSKMPVMNAPCYIDAIIIRECPIEGVQSALKTNYGEWSDEFVNEAWKAVHARGGMKSDNVEDDFHYLCADDFTFVDGKPTLKRKSSYQKIKDGELYTSPFTSEKYVKGRHFKCKSAPKRMYDKPFDCGGWSVHVETPKDISGFMWYDDENGQWFMSDEFCASDSYTDTFFCKSIRALKRRMRKWGLPVGTKVFAYGDYVGDDYTFEITE